MQCSPQELKEKLLRHLDNDYNVLDMAGVLAVMPVLEKYPITKEHLEQTRIGKYVNEMRRRTTDSHLARRAKDLVRRWQQLVTTTSQLPTAGDQSSVTTTATELSRVASSPSIADSVTAANGPRPARPTNGAYVRSPALEPVGTDRLLPSTSRSASRYQSSSAKVKLADKPSTPSHAFSQPSTPVTAAGTSRPVTPVFSSQPLSSQMTAVSTRLKAAGVTSLLTDSAKLSPSVSPGLSNGTASYEARGRMKHSESTDDLLAGRRKYAANGRNGMLKYTASGNSLSCNGAWSVHSVNDRDTSAVRGVTSSPDPLRSDAPLGKLKIKINRSSAAGSVSSPVAELSPATTRKTPKVATTAELIQKLHATGELRLVASETLNRIATNQIKHEADDSNVSIVPDGAKPRPHKKRRTDTHQPPVMTDSDLLEVKAERVRNFVQMSTADVSPADSDLLGLLHRLPAPGPTTVSAPCVAEAEPTVTDDDHRLQLPSLEGFEIDWDSDVYSVPVRPAPTDADVDRLLTDRWPLVNGQFDHRGTWTDWTQSYSAASYEGNMLHILPYVDVDD